MTGEVLITWTHRSGAPKFRLAKSDDSWGVEVMHLDVLKCEAWTTARGETFQEACEDFLYQITFGELAVCSRKLIQELKDYKKHVRDGIRELLKDPSDTVVYWNPSGGISLRERGEDEQI